MEKRYWCFTISFHDKNSKLSGYKSFNFSSLATDSFFPANSAKEAVSEEGIDHVIVWHCEISESEYNLRSKI